MNKFIDDEYYKFLTLVAVYYMDEYTILVDSIVSYAIEAGTNSVEVNSRRDSFPPFTLQRIQGCALAIVRRQSTRIARHIEEYGYYLY